MSTLIKVGTIGLLMSSVPTWTSSSLPEIDECTKDCPATVTDPHTGMIPAGVSFLLIAYGETVPGTATDECATCLQCEKPISFQFNGNGQGYCVSYNLNGTGWSNWLNHYSRFGVLVANCAVDGVPGTSTFCTEINGCDDQINPPPYTACINLSCGCQ